MSKLVDLGASLIMVSASLYPLLDIIHSGGDIEHGVSTLTLGLILILLIVVLLLGMLLFYFTWVDIIDEKKYDLLHFKGTVYTVPEIYLVKGLHSSSSLHKITSWRALYFVIVTDVLTISKVDVKHNMKLLFGLVAQLVRATDS